MAPKVQYRLCFSDSKHLCAANWVRTLRCWLAILHYDALGILHFSFGLTLNIIRLYRVCLLHVDCHMNDIIWLRKMSIFWMLCRFQCSITSEIKWFLFYDWQPIGKVMIGTNSSSEEGSRKFWSCLCIPWIPYPVAVNRKPSLWKIVPYFATWSDR